MADGNVSKKKPSFLVSWGQRDRTEGKTLSLQSAGPDQSSAPHWPILTVILRGHPKYRVRNRPPEHHQICPKLWPMPHFQERNHLSSRADSEYERSERQTLPYTLWSIGPTFPLPFPSLSLCWFVSGSLSCCDLPLQPFRFLNVGSHIHEHFSLTGWQLSQESTSQCRWIWIGKADYISTWVMSHWKTIHPWNASRDSESRQDNRAWSYACIIPYCSWDPGFLGFGRDGKWSLMAGGIQEAEILYQVL